MEALAMETHPPAAAEALGIDMICFKEAAAAGAAAGTASAVAALTATAVVAPTAAVVVAPGVVAPPFSAVLTAGDAPVAGTAPGTTASSGFEVGVRTPP